MGIFNQFFLSEELHLANSNFTAFCCFLLAWVEGVKYSISRSGRIMSSLTRERVLMPKRGERGQLAIQAYIGKERSARGEARYK